MTDQAGECNVNNTLLLQNAFSAEKEKCQDDDFADVKLNISKTAIIYNPGLQDQSSVDINQHNVSTGLDNIKTEVLPSELHYDMIHDLKIEEGISPNNIKIEFNNGLLYCEDCHIYCKDYCGECGMLVHILNRAALVNADYTSQNNIPNDILEIQKYFGEYHILALKVIPAGVRFGPFIGLNRTESSWKIKDGKFVVNKEQSTSLNWMQYINTAKNISEQNLQVFQFEHSIYYKSTCQIEEGNELLVYFGEEYQDSLNRNVKMDFIPTVEHIFKDTFACSFCCLGFSSKSYLVKHKIVCSRNADGGFSVGELTCCPSCKIHLDQKEYIKYHMRAYCCERNDRKCNRAAQINKRKARLCPIFTCQQCKYRTKYKGDLKNHVNLHHEVKMNKCGICCKRFKKKEVLKLHVANAHSCAGGKKYLEHSTGVYIKIEHARDEIKQFKCSLCLFRTRYKLNLKRHLSVNHSKHLKYNPIWKSPLKRHVEGRHLKETKYKCGTRGYKTNRKSNLKTHIEGKYLQEFKCEYKANQKAQLKINTNAKHLKVFKYKCDMCEYKANQNYHLRLHVQGKHLKEIKYKCDICDFKTNTLSHLNAHTNGKHWNEFKYKCDTCDFKTNFKSNLKVHVHEKHLHQFKYKCDRCDLKTNSMSHLNAHINGKHLNEFKYKCYACDFKTNFNSNLTTHIETKHLHEFKYECDRCEYKANQKIHLKVHIETKHLQEYKYNCDMCEYKTGRKAQLKSHIEGKHLNKFKYKCDFCDYKAKAKRYLKRHIDSIHLKIFKYKCEKCDYKSNFKCNLKKHTEGKHLN